MSNLRRAGFTLLELMLVLVIVAGVMAVAWPALSRTFASSDLREAAQTIREALNDAKRLARETGEPVLVRFEPDGHTVRFDLWHQSLERPDTAAFVSPFESADSSSASVPSAAQMMTDDQDQLEPPSQGLDESANSMANATSTGPRTDLGQSTTIDESIFVVEVKLGHAAEKPQQEEAFEDSQAVLDQTSAASSLDVRGLNRGNDPLAAANAPLAQLDEQTPEQLPTGLVQGAWIWFLPNGQSPAASLRLIDIRSRRELTMTIDPWSGSIEMGPDQKLDPLLFESTDGSSAPGA